MNTVTFKVKFQCAGTPSSGRCKRKLKLTATLEPDYDASPGAILVERVPSTLTFFTLSDKELEENGWKYSSTRYGWVCPNCNKERL